MSEAKPWLAWNEWWFGCATLEEARKAADLALQSSRHQARLGDGWADDTDRIGWGVQLVHCVEHNRQPTRCPYCEQEQGTPHLPDCDDFEEDHPERVVSLEHDFLRDYRLEPVPGAIEAVLGLASDAQLRAEVERREGASTAADLGRKVEELEAEVRELSDAHDRAWAHLSDATGTLDEAVASVVAALTARAERAEAALASWRESLDLATGPESPLPTMVRDVVRGFFVGVDRG